MPHIHVEIGMAIMPFHFSSDMFNVGLVHMPSFQTNNLLVLKGLSLLRIINFPISNASSKLWGILGSMSKSNDKFWMKGFTSILEKGLSPVLVFVSIFSIIEENKTHNSCVGFGFSILVMYFCISGFEDKFWCKRSLRAKLTSFDVLVGWNLEFQ